MNKQEQIVQAETQIKESVHKWLQSFVAPQNTTKEIVDNFYNKTSIPPADSCGYFYQKYLSPLIGLPIESFIKAISNIKVRIDDYGLYHLYF